MSESTESTKSTESEEEPSTTPTAAPSADSAADAWVDDLGRRAGAAIRRPAPTEGLKEVAQRRRAAERRSRTVIGAAMIAAVVVIGGGIAIARRDGGPSTAQRPEVQATTTAAAPAALDQVTAPPPDPTTPDVPVFTEPPSVVIPSTGAATNFSTVSPVAGDVPPVCTSDGAGCVTSPPAFLQSVKGGWTGESVEGAGLAGQFLDDARRSYQFIDTALSTFSGSVDGCGTGTAIIASEIDNVIVDRFSADVGQITRSGQWWVVPGMGTGALATMTGGGNVTVSSGGGGNLGTAEHSGFVDCSGAAPSPVPEPAPVANGTPIEFGWSVPIAAPTNPDTCTADGEACVTVQSAVFGSISGDWAGSAATALGLHQTSGSPIKYPTIGVLAFSGTIVGCGTGTAVIARYVYNEFGGADTNPNIVKASRWRIVPGYGTGDLVNLTGSGTVAAQIGDANLATTFTGSISC